MNYQTCFSYFFLLPYFEIIIIKIHTMHIYWISLKCPTITLSSMFLKNSITNLISVKNFYDLLTFVSESSEKLTQQRKTGEFFCHWLMRAVAYEYSVLLHVYSALSKVDRDKVFVELKRFKWVLQYASHWKVKVIAAICRLLGLRMASFLTKQYRKMMSC